MQRAVLAVCDRAADLAGLERATWARQGSGDGELAVLPVGEPEELVVDHYMREISAELARYNGRMRSDSRLRMRAAVHFGRLAPGENGYSGPAPVAVSRLANSDVLRGALTDAPEANLAVLVSAPVFEDTVASLATTLRPEDFRRVRIEEKEFAEDAWLWVPEQARAVTEEAVGPRATSGTRAAGQFVNTVLNSGVDASHAVFGFNFGADR